MQATFDLAPAEVPDCLVMNVYGPDEYIQWHHDEDDLFQTQQNPVEILSLTLGCDGVFCVQPRPASAAAHALRLPINKTTARIAERNLRIAVVAKSGSAMLMNGWFQTEWHHRTIPSTDWNGTWATVARTATKPPTEDCPRINITGRFIRKHNCPKADLCPPEASIEPPAANNAARMLAKDMEKLQVTNRYQVSQISVLQNEIMRLEDELNCKFIDYERHEQLVSQMEELQGQIDHLLFDKITLFRQLHALQRELYKATDTAADRDRHIYSQQRQMLDMMNEIQQLKKEKEKATAEATESKSKKARLVEKNEQRIRKITIIGTTGDEMYSAETQHGLKRLVGSFIKQAFDEEDLLFKTGYCRKQKNHRVLLAYEDVARILDAALKPENVNVAYKNFHLECNADTLKNCVMWKLKKGVASDLPFVPRNYNKADDAVRVRLFAIELHADFNVDVKRFLLQDPGSQTMQGEKTTQSRDKSVQECVKAWLELLRSEKAYQLKKLDGLPKLPGAWGDVTTIAKMPCAIWIKII